MDNNRTADRDRIAAAFFTPEHEMPRRPPPPTRKRAPRLQDRGLRALRAFVRELEPLPDRERTALINWLVDKYGARR